MLRRSLIYLFFCVFLCWSHWELLCSIDDENILGSPFAFDVVKRHWKKQRNKFLFAALCLVTSSIQFDDVVKRERERVREWNKKKTHSITTFIAAFAWWRRRARATRWRARVRASLWPTSCRSTSSRTSPRDVRRRTAAWRSSRDSASLTRRTATTVQTRTIEEKKDLSLISFLPLFSSQQVHASNAPPSRRWVRWRIWCSSHC